jgi:phage-related holin
MLDIRLPYFYNLPVAVLLVLYVVNKLEGVFASIITWSLNDIIAWGGLDVQSLLYLKLLLITLPALTAATWFFRQFYLRNDLYIREMIFILSVVNILGYLIPAFLPG